MGRSSQAKAQENRTRIVETACRMFRESGVENVSVAQVMAANAMTVGGFYKHFESKDALVAEAFALAFDQSRQAWGQVFQRADSVAESRCSALVRQYLRNRASAKGCPLLAFAAPVATGEVDGTCAEVYVSGTETLFETFVNEVTAADASGPPTAQDENRAMVLFAAMVGARLLAQAVGDEPWIKAMETAVNQAASMPVQR
ncbi:TetR/AcrR family transcriptional regulator [Pseudomonas sp. GD03860]|uniref:TetR/AcrR family transcriptional regulator n=1 Tax=Pseudomonas TaxID=286 RepID=UPI00236481AB|nr:MULTISPECIES: TetR/AcrR family transcriptional regulator [Pseudomonas]MDD2056775.1 TetR/AcrR family transcriptional regulator [Pseudomonas putida]MDH0638029.1 TetR/AcrR family transcriptional regulator [Pseudomonas sp. GD03860]